jgi:hypothetical protein
MLVSSRGRLQRQPSRAARRRRETIKASRNSLQTMGVLDRTIIVNLGREDFEKVTHVRLPYCRCIKIASRRSDHIQRSCFSSAACERATIGGFLVEGRNSQ